MLGYCGHVAKNSPIILARYASALAGVVAITFFYLQTHRFNSTTVAFTYLLGILGVSMIWGLGVAVFMSLAATLAYNYYFLPPTGTASRSPILRTGSRWSLSWSPRFWPVTWRRGRATRRLKPTAAAAKSSACTGSASGCSAPAIPLNY